MSMEKEIPTVFISYAWEDDVQQYAIDIGTRLLNEEGIEVLLDVWDTHVGYDLNQFMLQCVDNPDVNHVLIFCSPLYAEKVRTNTGGAATESTIIMPQVFNNAKQTKFIPIIIKRDTDNKVVKLTYLNSIKHYDLTTSQSDAEYRKLVNFIKGRPEYIKPQRAEYKSEEEIIVQYFKTDKYSNDSLFRKPIDWDSLDKFLTDLEDDLSLFVTKPGEQISFEVIQSKYDSLQPIKSNLVDLCSMVLTLDMEEDKILSFLSDVINVIYFKCEANGLSSWTDDQFDHYKVFLFEAIIYCAATMIKNRQYDLFHSFSSNSFFVTKAHTGEERVEISDLRLYPRLLQEGQPYATKYLSYSVELMKRNVLRGYQFDDLINVDVILFYATLIELVKNSSGKTWFPQSLPYHEFKKVGLFKRLESRRQANNICRIFGYEGYAELKSMLQSPEYVEKEQWACSYYKVSFSHVQPISYHIPIESIGSFN